MSSASDKYQPSERTSCRLTLPKSKDLQPSLENIIVSGMIEMHLRECHVQAVNLPTIGINQGN